MAASTRPNLNRWIAPSGGIAAGIVVALAALLIPGGTLEDLVMRSGIAALIPAAEPPLGSTARAVLMLGGGFVTAAVVWAGLFLLFGTGGLFDPARQRAVVRAAAAPGAIPATRVVDEDDRIPTLRRADAHPDAPARRPLSARDLGVPMPPVDVATPVRAAPPPQERDLPADLDQPLAAFDPAAVPDAPREPVRPVAALATPLRAPALEEGERITSVELPRAPIEDEGAPSIEALLRRLEQGTRRPSRPASPSIPGSAAA